MTPDILTRHAEMMRLSGGTGRPEDYLERLSYLLPFRGPEEGLLAFCGCCQGPLQVQPELGLWVSWQRSGAIAPLCAVCLEYLHRREPRGSGPATIYVLPDYDSLGRGYRGGLDSLSPVALAQLRMAQIEALMPKLDPWARPVAAATVARQAFLESAETLQGLARVWERQRPHRLKLGRVMARLKAEATAASLQEFDDTMREVPGAMQAYREALGEAGAVWRS